MNKKIALSVMLFWVLVACKGNVAQPTKTATSIAIASPVYIQITNTPQRVIDRTQSTQAGIPQPQYTASVSPSTTVHAQSNIIKQECFEHLGSDEVKNIFHGSLILITSQSNGMNYILDSSGHKNPLPTRSFYKTSPNGRYFAYRDETKLVIYTSANRLFRSFPWRQNWENLAYWLDDESLVIAEGKDQYPKTIIVLSILDGVEKIFEPDYPNIEKGSFNISWLGSGTTIYNSTLQRVIYPGLINKNNDMGYILWDMNNAKTLVNLPSSRWIYSPIWARDGSKFIVFDGDEFFETTRDGKIRQITHLNVKEVSNFNQNYDVLDYSLSPQGDLLAVWIIPMYSDNQKPNEVSVSKLAIIDTTSGNIFDPCISGGFDAENYGANPQPPIWIDNNLVVSTNYQKDDNRNDIILISLIAKKFWKIDENKVPVGWIADE